MEEERIEPPPYIHIESNEYSYRRHTRQKEEDIAVCECQYDILDPESPCGERCLNVHTNTECTPGYCRCGAYCKNQRFQRRQYARTRLVKTEGRGWGLLADENIVVTVLYIMFIFLIYYNVLKYISISMLDLTIIQAGQFIIEYCGEVISWKEAKQRSQAYETQGLMDAYIIYLNADESIDATRKGSLARFINHSCQPNCETRKWNVLGEVRVGIFAKQDIPCGTELSYDYNFEWYGGAMVRCLCGAPSCSGFLGAKSRGFQEATYLWEDDDDRFSVENIPLYDSTDDEPTSISKDILFVNDGPISQYDNSNTIQSTENSRTASTSELTQMIIDPLTASSNEFTPMTVEPLSAIPMRTDLVDNGSMEYCAQHTHDMPQNTTHQDANYLNQANAENNNHSEFVPLKLPKVRGRKPKHGPRKQFLNISDICDRLVSSVAREEILYCEEMKSQAASEIAALYDEIRPAVEEHERDSQDSVSTSLGEKWIEASCRKYKADFDLYATIIKNIASTPLRSKEGMNSREQNGMKYLENGP